MKQTAVEWLYERLERMISRTELYNIDKKHYLEEAKRIEKEQLFNCTSNMLNRGDDIGPETVASIFEQYYNETYKKN